MQNLTEFWNVTTRPVTARGGFGISIRIAEKRLRFLQSICQVIFPDVRSLVEWQQIVSMHRVQGVQVHDAHLVAVMRAAGISHILTLNNDDMVRYQGICALTPTELLENWPLAVTLQLGGVQSAENPNSGEDEAPPRE